MIIALTALAVLFLSGVAANNFVDPDTWHEMALIRESLTLGRLPLADRFAYTPTIYPVVHHEWGTGAILYFLATRMGAAGILTSKYLLCAGVAIVCVYCARRRGAGFAVFCLLAPIAILMFCVGVSTLRAQMFTLLMTAVLLCFLDCDRRGRRWWLAAWLPLYVVWVNLHGGFALGYAFLGLHTIEQFIRRRPARHLILALAAMAALVAINPYRLELYRYLWRGLLMDRPQITEWAPLWETSPVIMFAYLFSLATIGYAAYRIGVRKMPGLMLVLLTAYMALRHQRHLPIYALTWICYTPAYVQQTKLGDILPGYWVRRPRTTVTLWLLVGVLGGASFVYRQPWQLRIPANEGEHNVLVYPVGAVAYLDQVDFHGNLMVPFTVGAFVSWKLAPEVKVSIDGRFEVAYPPTALDEHMAFYEARPGWQRILTKYPTDGVLVSTSAPVSKYMSQVKGWQRVYRDDVYEVYALPGKALTPVDRSGERLAGSFP